MTAKRLSAVLLVAGLVLGAASWVWADDTQLTVTQDESSMERLIESYLVREHQLVVDEKFNADDATDLYLDLPFKAGPMPKFRISLDTQPLNNDQRTDAVTERGVLLNLYTGVIVPANQRAAVLEVLNDFNRRKAFCSVFIDTDGEIICSWILNVMSEGLPTEYVYDEVARVQNIWAAIWPDVSSTMGLSNTTK